MTKGIVVDKKGKKTIVLTKDGAFRRVFLRGDVHLGDEVHLPKRNFWGPFIPLASSFMVVLLSALIITTYVPSATQDEKVSAYVSMDLKASLEASLNDSMQVISWTPIPPTDETFVDEMNLTPFISFTLFAQKYLAASKKQGHLQEQPEVLMSLTMVDEQKDAQAFRMTIQNEMEKLSNSEVVQEPIAVTTMSTNNERRMEALEKGVSPAKYMLFLSASRHQVPFTLQEFKALSFKEIKKQLANSKETAWPWSVANTPEKNLIIEATP